MMSYLNKLSCNIREQGLVRLNARQDAVTSAGQSLLATIMPLDTIPAVQSGRVKKTDRLSFSKSELNLRQYEKSAAAIWVSIPTLPSN